MSELRAAVRREWH